MACTVKYDSDNNVEAVSAPNGKPSQLFEALNKNIFISDRNTSWDIQKNTYAGKVEKAFKGATKNVYETGEPKLFYKTRDVAATESLEEVLLDPNTKDIEMGFVNPKNDSFITVSSLKLSSNEDTYQGFLTSQVRKGQLSTEKSLIDGEYKFKGKGLIIDESRINARSFVSDATLMMEGEKIQINLDGTFDFNPTQGLNVAHINGEVQIIPDEFLEEMLHKNKYDNSPELFVRLFILKGGHSQKKADKKPTRSENQLKDSLYNVLKRLGISVTTLDNYKKSHNSRYFGDPSIRGLADIANKTIALQAGKLNMDDFTEEVAHFMIESYTDQNSIASALADVVNHPEYNQFAEQYRAKYSKKIADPVELEDAIRKEVLGKILTKAIRTNFSEENISPKEKNIFSKLMDILRSYITGVKTYFRPSIKSSMELIMDDIVNSLKEEQLDDFDESLLTSVDRVYFSLASPANKDFLRELQKVGLQIDNAYRAKGEQTMGFKEMLSVENLTSIETQLDMGIKAMSTVQGFVTKAQKVVDSLGTDEAIPMVTANDIRAVASLDGSLNKLKNTLPEIHEYLNSDDIDLDDNLRVRLVEITETLDGRIKPLFAQINGLKGALNKDAENLTYSELDSMLTDFNKTPEEREEILRRNKQVTKDTTSMFTQFGFMSNSKELGLPLLQKIFSNIATKVIDATLKKTKSLIANSGKYKKHQTSIIQKDNGKSTHHIIGFVDEHRFEKDVEAVRVKLIKDVLDSKPTAYTEKQVKKMIEKNTFKDVFSEQDIVDFEKTLKEARSKLLMTPYNEASMANLESKYDKAGLSKITKNVLKSLSRKTGRITKKAIVEGNRRDLTKLSANDVDMLKAHQTEHQMMQGAYTSKGQLKYGLVQVKVKDLSADQRAEVSKYTSKLLSDPKAQERSIILADANVDTASVEAQIAIELQRLDLVNSEEFDQKGKDTMNTIKEEIADMSEVDKIDWLLANGNIRFSDAYYNAMGESESLTDKALEVINQIQDPQKRADKLRHLETYKQHIQDRNALLRQFRVKGNPVDIDFANMPGEARKAIIDIDSEASTILERLNIFSELDLNPTMEFETYFTEDFKQLLSSRGRDTSLLDLALEHMSGRNRDKVTSMRHELDAYIQAGVDPGKGTLNFIERIGEKGVFKGNAIDAAIDKSTFTEQGEALGLQGEELDTYVERSAQAEIVLEEYAKSKIAPYFRKSVPKGYEAFLANLKTEDGLLEDFIDGKSNDEAAQYLEYNPSFSWRDEVNSEESINKLYNHEGSYEQPKVAPGDANDYFNHEMTAKFGITKSEYLANPTRHDLATFTPRKNQEEYQALVDIIDMHKQVLANYDMTKSVSPHQRVQISVDGLERITDLAKTGRGKVLKDMLTDIVKVKKDEMLYGEELDGEKLIDSGIRSIPRYYVSKLEDPSIVSESTISSAVVALQRSEQYKARKDAAHKVESVIEHIAQKKYKKGLSRAVISGESSNFYKMAREFVDHAMYGINENGRLEIPVGGKVLDVAEVTRNLITKSSKLNLKYNPFVDLTSLTTGLFNNFVAQTVSQDYSRLSGRKANMILPSLLGKYLLETGKIDKTSDLNKMLEVFGITDLESRVSNSKFNKALRLLDKGGFGLSKLANMPVTPKIMLAALQDTKFITKQDGSKKFYTFPQYFEYRKALDSTISSKKLAKEFETAGKPMYEYLDLTGESVKAKASFAKDAGLTEEEATDMFTRQIEQTANTVRILAARQDGVMNETDKVAASRHFLGTLATQHKGWLFLNIGERFKSKHMNIATGKWEEGHYRTVARLLPKFLKSLASNRSKAEAMKELADQGELTYNTYASVRRVMLESALLFLGYMIGGAILDDDDEDDSSLTTLSKLIYMRTLGEVTSQNVVGIPGLIRENTKDPIVMRRYIGDHYALAGATLSGDAEKRSKYFRKVSLYHKRKDQFSDLQSYYDTWLFMNNDNILELNSGRGEDKK